MLELTYVSKFIIQYTCLYQYITLPYIRLYMFRYTWFWDIDLFYCMTLLMHFFFFQVCTVLFQGHFLIFRHVSRIDSWFFEVQCNSLTPNKQQTCLNIILPSLKQRQRQMIWRITVNNSPYTTISNSSIHYHFQ